MDGRGNCGQTDKRQSVIIESPFFIFSTEEKVKEGKGSEGATEVEKEGTSVEEGEGGDLIHLHLVLRGGSYYSCDNTGKAL